MALQVFVKCQARCAGEPSGDAFWYSEEATALWLMVVDGLGSGPEAAAAASRAVTCVQQRTQTLTEMAAAGLESVLRDCDAALRGTRGAAIGLAVFDARAGQGYYGGVGNVELRVLGQVALHPTGQPGILGTGLRRVRIETFAYQPGDLVVMHSDGLSSRFHIPSNLATAWNLEALGEKLVEEHANKSDDLALVLLRQYAA